MSKEKWSHIEALLSKGETMDTVNTKLVINDGFCDFELWAHVGKIEKRWVWVDLKISIRPEHTSDETPIVANLKRQLVDANKRLLEIVCAQATMLLQSDERTIEEITGPWIGTRFEPSGTCETVKCERMPEGIVTSPLDAFAKLVHLKLEHFDQLTENTNG